MINRILVYILCKWFKVEAKMLYFGNWRALQPYELLYRMLKHSLPVYCPDKASVDASSHKIIFKGRVWNLKNKDFAKTEQKAPYYDDRAWFDTFPIPDDAFKRLSQPLAVHFKDFQNSKHIILNKIPTYLLIFFMKRNLNKQLKIKNKEDENYGSENEITGSNDLWYIPNGIKRAVRKDLGWSSRQPEDDDYFS